MTSQLNVDTIVDKAGSGGTNVKVGNTSTYVADGGSATQNLVQGLAKAWVHFDAASTLTDRNSLNASSLTDNGTGDHTITFSNAFANIYLALSGGGDHDGEIVSRRDSSHATTTTTERFCLATSGGSLVDRDRANVLFHGDLA